LTVTLDSEFSDTKAIYNLTHRQIHETDAGRLMRDYLWSPFGGYVGQLSWATRDQIEGLVRAANAAPGTLLLDLCCGTGGIALHVARTFGSRIVGLDYAEAAVAFANQQARQARLGRWLTFLHGNALALPFANASFDAAFSVDSLVIVPRRWKVLQECARVLRPGGILAFSDEVCTGPIPRDIEVLQAINVYGRLYPETPQTYRRLLEDAGFALLEQTDTTASFAAISERWAAAYDRYRDQMVAMMGPALFRAGRAFFDTLGQQARQGVIGQIRIVARKEQAPGQRDAIAVAKSIPRSFMMA
jgi:sarcosine/dimethylglycine N-methyltransferase